VAEEEVVEPEEVAEADVVEGEVAAEGDDDVDADEDSVE